MLCRKTQKDPAEAGLFIKTRMYDLKDSSFARAVLEIQLSSFKSNYRLLKSLCPTQFFCPMLKDNAYGHGAVELVQALQAFQVKQIGLISATEAWQIREFVPDPPNILIFGPVLNKSDWQWIATQENLIPVISNWLDLEAAARMKKLLKVHLKFDTGFTRLGFCPSEAEKIKSFIDKNSFLQLDGICTQLISGWQVAFKQSATFKQRHLLCDLQHLFSVKYRHLLNTEALVSSFVHDDKIESSEGARVGIGLYGIKPFIECQDRASRKKWEGLSFQNVSTLKSYVVDVHHLKKGGSVSYEGTWKAKRDSHIATVSLGYGDGLPRRFSSKGRVLYRGQFVPLAGRICMDFFMIDVTDISGAPSHIGEEVVIFGRQGDSVLSVSEQAACIGTLPYEIFVNLGERVKRAYIN